MILPVVAVVFSLSVLTNITTRIARTDAGSVGEKNSEALATVMPKVGNEGVNGCGKH
ncbi:hypothetical protein CCHOA_09525 [Corynebacterium choanae]|uniref:Uncharacterized protein n=1 Tax=Corynebacterium choanae TaxID=1862358 RepID=A0A3G6JB81_9CORY|nr:hypothetical protein CCHOA_09525 [Corynebacterium choanae]